jgi:hypothetical protein
LLAKPKNGKNDLRQDETLHRGVLGYDAGIK